MSLYIIGFIIGAISMGLFMNRETIGELNVTKEENNTYLSLAISSENHFKRINKSKYIRLKVTQK